MEQFIITWWPIIYLVGVFIGYVILYVWWNLLSSEVKKDTVWWPQVIFIALWPLVSVIILPLGTIIYLFLSTGDLIVYIVKHFRKADKAKDM